MKFYTIFKKRGIVSVLLLSLMIILSCDKEEDANPPINQEGGEVYQYQLVEINYPNELPEESEFEANLGDVPVTITKTNEHTLKFVVPVNMPLGYAELVIPELNNTTVKYVVLEPQLVQTVDETMESFITSGTDYFSSPNLTNTQFVIAKDNFEKFQQYYAQYATSEEKKQIALFYQVNKLLIDDLMAFNPDNLSARFTAEDILIITKFTTAVAISVGGAFTVLYAPEPSLKILGVAISGLAASKAVYYHDQLAARSIKVVLFDLGGLVGQSNRGIQNGVVVLQSDVAENINFAIGSRPLQPSDADSDSSSLSNFFSSQSSYNEMIVKLNNVIASVNTFTPSFLQFSTFDLASLVTDPQTVSQQVTSEMMQDISFSINHPNLELVSATLSDEGQLNLKVKIIGEPASTPVTSTLNYTYSDAISSFSGSFPIEVNSSVSNLFNFSFYDQYDISTCIGPDSFSCNWKLSVSFSGGSPVGGTIFHRTLWDNENDGFFEGSTGYFSASVTNANTSLNNNIYTVNPPDNGYCWGNPNTQSKVEYYYVSPTGVESPHYFSSVPR